MTRDERFRRAGIRLDRFTDNVLTIFFLFIMLLGVYCVIDSLYLYNNAQDRGSLKFKPDVESDNAQLTLPDSVAWLTLNDTSIDFPVMQGEDNLEYIDKDPYGNYSLSGSIFLDSRNSADFTDDYSLIYGHHMEGGLMFGSLDKYFEEEYLKNHRSGFLITKDTVYRIDVFAVVHVLSTNSLIFDPGEHPAEEVWDFVEKNADVYVEPKEGRLLALSTCTDNVPDNRSIVFCTIRDRKEAGD